MKNILIELADEAGLAITANARVQFFNEIVEALKTSTEVQIGKLSCLIGMDPRDIAGSKSQLIRLSKLGIVVIETVMLNSEGGILGRLPGALKLSEVGEKEGLSDVDLMVSYSKTTLETLAERSGVDSDFLVTNPYEVHNSKNTEISQTAKDELQSKDAQDDAAETDDSTTQENLPSLASFGGEVPRSHFEEKKDSKSSEKVSSTSSQATINNIQTLKNKPEKKDVVLSLKTRLQSKKMAAYVVGMMVAVVGLYLIVFKSKAIDDQYSAIDRQIKEPAEGLRVVKMSEIEQLYETIEKLKAENESMAKKTELAISNTQAKVVEQLASKRSEIEKEAYERGRVDAVGVALSLRERVAEIAKQKVILTGGCEAIGRGNRIDRINLDGYGANVKYWLVDPTNISIAGVVATNEKLMEQKDGPVLEVRCFGGESKMIPAMRDLAIGADGKSHETTEKNPPAK
jgi:hypothetical protein